MGGYCLIFRLTVDNYHRYCYIDNGTKSENILFPAFCTRSIRYSREDINYKRNCREYTVLHTENFDDVVQIEVGAMMVGRIKNHHGACSFKKGEEKGMFEFGGSTIVLLVKKDILSIDGDILANSAENIETAVKMGERIAVRSKQPIN
jgi:phosphatidylserine decarboxylase